MYIYTLIYMYIHMFTQCIRVSPAKAAHKLIGCS